MESLHLVNYLSLYLRFIFKFMLLKQQSLKAHHNSIYYWMFFNQGLIFLIRLDQTLYEVLGTDLHQSWIIYLIHRRDQYQQVSFFPILDHNYPMKWLLSKTDHCSYSNYLSYYFLAFQVMLFHDRCLHSYCILRHLEYFSCFETSWDKHL